MCGRYSLTVGAEQLARQFLAEFAEELMKELEPREEITPGTGVVAIFEDRDRGGRRGDIFDWGLVPSWCKDPRTATRPINARSETVASKPTFREPFRYRRCLVPMTGFFEWDRKTQPRRKYTFSNPDVPLLAVAGVWDHWQHADGSEILSLALLTQPANKVMAPIHHRMPVILEPAVWDQWLDTSSTNGGTAWRKSSTGAGLIAEGEAMAPGSGEQMDLFSAED
jgi:putative SOS response-associated peptidase YedK